MQVEAEFAHLLHVIEGSGPYDLRVAKDEADRARIWKGRKSAFSAVGRLSPDYIVQDGVVPRSRLGEALATIERLSANYGIRVANVFHAGDGNLHPLILYDGRVPGELERAEELAGEIIAHVHRPGRLDHRRAWRGDGKAALHAHHVQRGGSAGNGRAAPQHRPG